MHIYVNDKNMQVRISRISKLRIKVKLIHEGSIFVVSFFIWFYNEIGDKVKF